jgi:transposase
VGKRRVGRYPKAFRQMAVDRLNQCENIVELAKELGVHRRLLYAWREKLAPVAPGEGPPANAREVTLRKEVGRLKRVLAEKVLEVDFFKGALQHVEARRQRSDDAGAQGSTPTSGTSDRGKAS